jgi:hypothetical protein
MKAPGVILAIGEPKGKPKSTPERDYAREMYSALRDEDEEGFISAALALKGCKGGGMDDEEDEEGAPDSEG